ncbi:LysR family transcriptional regulator [Phreatobacter stygius]|uniref:LysR family transcriptional regulator n=1 Tax=Phreatobacter stygius TaxID=1940610 RepID=A0A4D7B664_9HYPH|nr:LysR family transcriptional regulator [Phreatobacter stygius]QCI65660.1 LysR family transcriptional regulator [Phreatobacter stygius]
MRVKTYPQLDGEALALLQARVATLGSKAAAARELGVSRTAVSSALSGSYVGDTKHLRAKIVEAFADQVFCPHLDRALAPTTCKTFRERDIGACTGSRDDVKHWQACQGCPQNPASRSGAGVRTAEAA